MGSVAKTRLGRELEELRKMDVPWLRGLEVEETNLFKWTLLLLPQKEPYSAGAWKIQLEFPAEYPFKPPKLALGQAMYHPQVDEKGQLCLATVAAENWKPGTRMRAVLEALVGLVEAPQTERPLRPDLADLLTKDPQAFHANAKAHTAQHALPRPTV